MKKSIINNRIVLEADEGKVITDGNELYSSKLYLGDGISEDDLYEIPIEEYNKILEEQEKAKQKADGLFHKAWKSIRRHNSTY